MEKKSGDKYLKHVAAFIRANERGLAESGLVRRKPPPPEPSYLAPLGLNWLSPTVTQKPLVFSIDTHHLFYILVKLQAMGFEIGSLDVHIESPSRPMSYANIYSEQKDTDTLSLASLRSSFSAVSKLSLGGGWWTAPEPPNTEAELKYIYSSFTKLPSLAIGAPGNKVITELLNDSPNQNAIPLDVFKNLQRLECENIDPRTLLGWDRLAESLKSLKIKKSGLEDVSQLIIGAVLDDQARRQGNFTRRRQNNSDLSSTQRNSSPTRISNSGEEEEGDPSSQADKGKQSSSVLVEELSSLKWAFLKHLYLPDNSLTSFPTSILRYLTSLTHLDLSSNLLVSIPSGLAELYNLRSLNLSDNLIDSVLGIYLNLGQILSLILAHNRLDSLCGLERLLALERVDLRHNLLEESSEIGRLSSLPNLKEVCIEGNPLVEIEEGYRVACFNYFWKEGKEITLDGSQPSLYERRSLSLPDPPPTITPNSTSSAPVIAIEHSRGPVYTHSQANDGPSSSSPSPPPPKTRLSLSPPVHPSGSGHRRKKLKRIVELEGSDHSSPLQSYPHSRIGSMDIIREQGPTTDTHSGQHTQTAMESERNPPPLASDATLSFQRPRHSRYQSEYVQSISEMFPSSDTSLSEQEQANLKALRHKPARQGSATLTSRSERRRARMSTSFFEASAGDARMVEDESIDSYRQKIESLKQDMGDSWLKVYNQSSES